MRQMRTIFFALSALLIVPIVVTGVALAASKDISQSYNSISDIQAGAIVSVDATNADYVTMANTSNASKLLGVAVESDTSLLAVDPDANKVQIAKNGSVPVLVSTVNGDIKNGDRITVSPFNGVGMKAIGPGYVVGRAQANFNSSSKGATKQQVLDKNGQQQSVTVGFVQVDLNPKFDSDVGGEGLNGVQQWVRSLTGHTVSKPRVIVSLVVAVATIIAVVVLMYASIYGSIISIGRNPLAKQSVFRALSHVVFMAVLIVSIAFILIYLLLR
jgi:hypothetical protein